MRLVADDDDASHVGLLNESYKTHLTCLNRVLLDPVADTASIHEPGTASVHVTVQDNPAETFRAFHPHTTVSHFLI